MKNKLKTLITIVAATIAPALITSSSQAWTIYGYQFGDTYIQDSYDWDSGMSFSCILILLGIHILLTVISKNFKKTS